MQTAPVYERVSIPACDITQSVMNIKCWNGNVKTYLSITPGTRIWASSSFIFVL